MDNYNISPSGEKTEWDGNPFNPHYEDKNGWYTIKKINGRVTSVYIEGVRHDRLTFVTEN
jgi:hypothetical protein